MSRPPLTESVLVHREWVAAHAEDGVRCSLCTQRVQVYRRHLTRGMVRALARLYQLGDVHEPVSSREFRHFSTDFTTIAPLFGLIVDEGSRREDGGRAGWWFCTEFGRAFLHGQVTIPKYCRVFDTHALSFYGRQVDVHHAFRSPFDLREVMGVLSWGGRDLLAGLLVGLAGLLVGR